MTAQLDPAALRALVEKARRVVRSAQKASSGPWRKFRSIYGNDTVAIMQGEEPGYDEAGNRLKRWPEIVTWMGFDGADTSETKRHANARAIVAAVNFVRDDLPRLLAAHDDERAADKARIAELEAAATLFTDIPNVSPGRFVSWPANELAAQCLMQARDQLDPEYSTFMAAVGATLVSSLERVAKLEAALEPFAKDADDWYAPGVHYDDSLELWQTGRTSVTVGHLRAGPALQAGEG